MIDTRKFSPFITHLTPSGVNNIHYISLVSIKCFSDRNKSELFAHAVAFGGLHRQQSFGLLRGLLYLEACKSRSASGINQK